MKTILQRRMYLCAICKSNICFICLTIFFLEKFKDFVLVTYPSQSSHASIFLDQKPQNLVAFLHFFQLSVITSKPKHVNFQCLWFRDSKQYIDILPKKIVLFPIPILILFPVTSPAPFYRFPVSLQDLQKPHWKPITPCHIKGGQKHRTKNIRQKTSDKKHRTKTLIRITTCHIKREQKTSNNVSLKIFLFKNIGVSLKISFLTIIST